MFLAILLNLYQKQSLLNAKERKERLDLVVYNILKLLLIAEHLLGNRPKA
jgi:hypothetical protein